MANNEVSPSREGSPEVTLTIERMGQSGDGIAKMPDGRLAFIPYALPGETVSAQIQEERKNYVRATLQTVIYKAPSRIQPVCPIFGRCGGCSLQHWRYSEELAYKEERVRRALLQVGQDPQVVASIRGSVDPLSYRNKGQFPFGRVDGQVVLGLYRKGTHEVIPARHCDIQDDLVNKVLSWADTAANDLDLPVYDERRKSGVLRHLLIRSSRLQGRLLVLVVAYQEHPRLDEWAKRLLCMEEVAGVALNINQTTGNRVLGPTTRLLAGESFVLEQLLGDTFQLSFTSFFQVNPRQAELLYEVALGFLPETRGVVWDLYSGVGTLACLAAHHSHQVVALELNEDAVRDARHNFMINRVTNVSIHQGRVEDMVQGWVDQGRRLPDTVIVDPPRAGLALSVTKALQQLLPGRIIYVSCNPETWARDVERLSSYYILSSAIPVDMFPRTDHVEVASLLTRRPDVPG